MPVTTNSSGAWSVSGLINAMYLVTVTKGTYSFYPAASPVTVNFANVTNVNFQAGWAIAFQVTLGGVGLTGVSMTTAGPPAQTVVTDSSGSGQFTGLPQRHIHDHPQQAWLYLQPTSYSVTISGGNSNLKTFTATFTGMAGLEGESAEAGAPEGAAVVPEDASQEGASPADIEAPTRREALAARLDDGVSSGQGDGGTDADGSVRSEALTTVTATYYYWDHLGTVRLVAPQAPTLANVERHDFEPFGVELRTSTNAGTSHLWTGQERDGNSATPGQTGYDYMHARYYGSNLGRFMVPDPAMESATAEFPQSWNRYAYVVNNPLRFTDPTGRIIDDSALEKNKKYQEWKKKFLSTEAGKKEWAKWNDRQDLTIHMKYDPKRTRGTVTQNYQWDKSGKLTSADMVFGPNSGQPSVPKGQTAPPDLARSYPFGSTLSDPGEVITYLFSHEFGHVSDAETPEGASEIQFDEQFGKDLMDLMHKVNGPYQSAYDKSDLPSRKPQNDQNMITLEQSADRYAKPIVEATRP